MDKNTTSDAAATSLSSEDAALVAEFECYSSDALRHKLVGVIRALDARLVETLARDATMLNEQGERALRAEARVAQHERTIASLNRQIAGLEEQVAELEEAP